jgi:hypothetical protein
MSDLKYGDILKRPDTTAVPVQAACVMVIGLAPNYPNHSYVKVIGLAELTKDYPDGAYGSGKILDARIDWWEKADDA